MAQAEKSTGNKQDKIQVLKEASETNRTKFNQVQSNCKTNCNETIFKKENDFNS